jgi:hypothetical protein
VADGMADMITSASMVERVSEVVEREVAGERFLVPVRGRLADLQELFVLNEVGSWIWERLDGRTSQTILAEGLVTEFEVESQQAGEDLAKFLEELASVGLARVIAVDVG